MATYERSYAGLEGDAKRAKALKDVVGYLGWEDFTRIHQQVLALRDVLTFDAFRKAISFAGVQGYPARAWYEPLFGVQPDQPKEEG